jgi:hypothetical protein
VKVDAIDVVATKAWGNCEAKASIVVDGEMLVPDVPVSLLLDLEKELNELHTFVAKLPTLDPSERWEYSDTQSCYTTEPVHSARTKKVPKVIVKYPATDQHPAQTELITEDVIAGYWRTIKYSGSIPLRMRDEMLERVELLQRAVRYAIQQANTTEVPDRRIGATLLNYVFKG